MRTKAEHMLSIGSLVALFFVVLLGVMRAGRTQAATTAVVFTKDGLPLSGTVRLLCYASPTARPHADRLLTVTTGAATTPLPVNCNYAAALHQLHVQPSGFPDHGPAYTVYHTNWPPGTVVPPAVGSTIQLSVDNALTLFHVVASLGWEPAPDTLALSVQDFTNALREASAHLYNVTEGQMAFGPVSVHTGGEQWSSADLRVLPANDYRPAAFVGGITDSPTVYVGSTNRTTRFTPAGIYLGRSWDAARGPTPVGDGLWTAVPTGTHTIIHEWNHYALFLYDEYQRRDGLSRYCLCDNLPFSSGCGLGNLDASTMAYHYTANELWHDNDHAGAVSNDCYETWNWHFHENTDWKVLANWGFIQGLPVEAISFPTALATQSPGITTDLFGSEPGYRAYLPLATGGSAAPAPPVTEPTVTVRTAALPSSTPVHAEVYLLAGGSSDPAYIFYQGQPVGSPVGDSAGEMTLLGVGEADRARVFVKRFAGGGRYSYPASALDDKDLTPGTDLYADGQSWEYELYHRFEVENGVINTLTLALTETTLANPPIAQLCSLDAAVGCADGWKNTMTDGGGYWETTFSPLPGMVELPRHAIMRITAPELGVQGDIIRWVQVHGGVGPGHGDAIAPLADGQVMINTPTDITGLGDCNVASFAPAASSEAINASLPQDVQGIVGQAYEVRISLTQDNVCPIWGPTQNATIPPVVLNMGYEQADIDLLGANEATLVLLHLDPTGWTEVNTNFAGRNAELNWISEAIEEDGIYAIGWTQ